MTSLSSATGTCPVCTASATRELPGFGSLGRVTSDCRTWPAGGRLTVCERCGGVSKPADGAFVADIEAIYADYAIYHQAGGAEQRSFDTGSGAQAARSARLIERLLHEHRLPDEGRLLDVGCGNGSTLRAFSHLRPRWALVGTELDDRHRQEVEAIPRASFTAGPPGGVAGRFDLVTLVHVLEHVLEPVDFLRSLASRLAPAGRLLVEVPHHPDNPFELLIADHRSHFTTATLPVALAAAGYAVESVTAGWIAREVSVVARVAGQAPDPPRLDPQGARAVVEGGLDWLVRTRDALRRLGADGRPLGLFGTSIAGTWLAGNAGGAVTFFVDEDPHRVGRRHLGLPIVAPTDLAPGSRVFVGLPPAAAAAVVARLMNPAVEWIAPPA